MRSIASLEPFQPNAARRNRVRRVLVCMSRAWSSEPHQSASKDVVQRCHGQGLAVGGQSFEQPFRFGRRTQCASQ
jgi:hypothetical protein